MSNIDKQALKPVGKFAFESVGARWHHVKHGEAQITLPKLPLMRLYAENDVQALLDELEAANKMNIQLQQKCEIDPRTHQIIDLEERISELEARQPYGYLRENDGQIQISIGGNRPHDRSGGCATPWFAIYTAAGTVKGE